MLEHAVFITGRVQVHVAVKSLQPDHTATTVMLCSALHCTSGIYIFCSINPFKTFTNLTLYICRRWKAEWGQIGQGKCWERQLQAAGPAPVRSAPTRMAAVVSTAGELTSKHS